MKQFELQEFGLGKLRLVECAVPQPGVSEVLVRMRAASLNFRDYMTIQGTYNPKLHMPLVPLSDGVGVVEAIGQKVSRFKVGDRVAACFMQGWIEGAINREKSKSSLGGPLDGVLREYAVFPAEGLVHVPEFLSDEEGACLPCAGVTAWHALFERTTLPPGSSVLLQGTGGVSILALQLGVAAGFRMIVTSSSDEKLKVAKELGASETINYKAHADWDKEARRLTGGEGVDHVVEVGGSNTLPVSLRAVRMGGVVTIIGALSGAEPTLTPVPVLMNSLRLQGIYVGSRMMFERLNRMLSQHAIRPNIDRVFDWKQIADALEYMQGQQHIGKICLKF
jgi:NADPH:quinone reductase-like Zn-dependent oxidoreductase